MDDGATDQTLKDNRKYFLLVQGVFLLLKESLQEQKLEERDFYLSSYSDL